MRKLTHKEASWMLFAVVTIGYVSLVCLGPAIPPPSASLEPIAFGPTAVYPPYSNYLRTGVRLPDEPHAPASPACVSFWRAIAALDLRPYTNDGRNDWRGTVVALEVPDSDGLIRAVSNVIATHECHPPDITSLEALQEHGRELLIQCRTASDLVRASGSGPALEGCLRELIWYRFYAVDWLTREVSVDKITDPAVLVHRLLARGSRIDSTKAGEIAAIAERLMALDPHNADAAATAVQFRYVELRSHGEGNGARERFERVLAAAEALDGDGSSLFLREMRLNQARLRRDLNEMRRLAERERERRPESALGTFYLAWAAYLANDVDDSADLVVQSERREPTSLQAYAAAKKIADGEFRGPDIGIFQEDAGDFGFVVTMQTRDRPVEFRGGYALIPSLNQDLSSLVRALDLHLGTPR